MKNSVNLLKVVIVFCLTVNSSLFLKLNYAHADVDVDVTGNGGSGVFVPNTGQSVCAWGCSGGRNNGPANVSPGHASGSSGSGNSNVGKNGSTSGSGNGGSGTGNGSSGNGTGGGGTGTGNGKGNSGSGAGSGTGGNGNAPDGTDGTGSGSGNSNQSGGTRTVTPEEAYHGRMNQFTNDGVSTLEEIEAEANAKYRDQKSADCTITKCTNDGGLVPDIPSSNDPGNNTGEYFRELLDNAGDPSGGQLIDKVAGIGGDFIDDKPYKSDHASEIEFQRGRLKAHPSNGPQQYDAKKAALDALRKSDDSYLKGLKDAADIYLEAGKFLVDIATDVIPFTSVLKDTYRLFVGKDPMTGRQLSSFERAMAGAFIGMAIVTVGASNGLKLGLKEVEVIAEVTSEESRIVEKVVAETKASGEFEELIAAPDKWDRLPKSLQDEMTMEAAKNGPPEAKSIIKNLSDPKYKGFEKMQYTVKSNEGRVSVVHYVKDPKTGKLMDFKFKKHSVE